jgi:hypothetical protein
VLSCEIPRDSKPAAGSTHRKCECACRVGVWCMGGAWFQLIPRKPNSGDCELVVYEVAGCEFHVSLGSPIQRAQSAKREFENKLQDEKTTVQIVGASTDLQVSTAFESLDWISQSMRRVRLVDRCHWRWRQPPSTSCVGGMTAGRTVEISRSISTHSLRMRVHVKVEARLSRALAVNCASGWAICSWQAHMRQTHLWSGGLALLLSH